ncbi:MAG: hypothetical protein QOI41_4055 [Myxococcales bacterium]|nr:hypothetical protein [Myxococcales bacterium]
MSYRNRVRLVSVALVATGCVAFVACGGSSGDSPTAGTDGEGGTVGPGGGDGSSGGISADSGPLPDDDSGARNVAAGGACTKDSDCISGGCDYSLRCAVGRSCTQHNGGDTCGATGKDSCCTSIPVPKPGAAYKLDKYNITAGRMRVFIEKTKGDVRGFIQANRPSWFEPAWDAWVPNKMDDGTAVTGTSHLFDPGKGQDGVYQQLGPIHYGAAEMGGNEGCLTKEVGNARTYRLPDDVNTNLFADVQQYPQDILDQKSQQCITFFMVAAFCAWDGGRMPTLDELDYAWDGGDPTAHTYPWGNTPIPGGWNTPYPTDPAKGGFSGSKVTPAGSDQTMANYRYDFWMPSSMLCIGDDPAKCDYSVFIAPPGTFPKGDGPFGHSDLAGNVYNTALPMGGTPGTDPAATKRTVGLNRTGAFDGHAIPNKHPITGFRTWQATNKYLAVGGRCAR